MLTERRIIGDAKSTGNKHYLWDDAKRGVGGFGVRVSAGGTKAYVPKYRDAAGRQHIATLCLVGEIGLREAREKAGAERAAVRDGEVDVLERRREAREVPTVAESVAKGQSVLLPTTKTGRRRQPLSTAAWTPFRPSCA